MGNEGFTMLTREGAMGRIERKELVDVVVEGARGLSWKERWRLSYDVNKPLFEPH